MDNINIQLLIKRFQQFGNIQKAGTRVKIDSTINEQFISLQSLSRKYYLLLFYSYIINDEVTIDKIKEAILKDSTPISKVVRDPSMYQTLDTAIFRMYENGPAFANKINSFFQ